MSAFLDKAIQVHVQWKIKLLTAINGGGTTGIDRKVVCTDCNCDLGKWIHGEGATFASVPDFKALKEAHEKFHRSIGGVLDLIQAGKTAEAKAALQGGEFGKLSSETVQYISKLKQNATIKV